MEHFEQQVALQKGRSCKDRNLSPFIVFYACPPSIEELLDESPDAEKLNTSLDKRAHILIVETMKSSTHELASGAFEIIFLQKVARMGLDIASLRSTTCENRWSRKEPDASFKPIPSPAERGWSDKWPNLVLEVGVSEHERKLAIDAQNWLEADASTVEIVVTMKCDPRHPKIHIRIWENVAVDGPKAEARQEVYIEHHYGWTTISGTLILNFQKIFNRPPSPANPQETNIVFSQQDLPIHRRANLDGTRVISLERQLTIVGSLNRGP